MARFANPSTAFAAVASLMSFSCAVVGVRTVKEPPYQVVLEEGDKQIREYAGYIIAQTKVEGEFDQTSNVAFRRLFNFISGNNTKEDKIAMTAPVITAESGEKISMTAPVLRQKSKSGWTMAFVMPNNYTMHTVPKPANPLVEIKQVDGYTVAVKRFSGTSSEKKFKQISEEVSAWLRSLDYQPASEPRLARYDPPFTLPFLRRNEVHIQVRR